MLKDIENQELELLAEIKKADWATKYANSETPLSKKALQAWISGGKKPKKT
jgi:hypothetical protein